MKRSKRKFKMGELKEKMYALDAKNLYPIDAAKILGISMRTLYTLSYRYNINFAKAPYGYNILSQKNEQDI